MKERPSSSMLKIVHHHPGRLRVRADAFLDGGPLAERTRMGLVRFGGVRSIVHDPRTGSLLVQYDPHRIDAERLIDSIVELSALSVAPLRPPRPEPGAGIVALVRRLDAITQELTGGRFDLGVLVPGGLAALGVYSFLKGPHKRMPRWDSFVYWGYAVFLQAHPAPPRAAP